MSRFAVAAVFVLALACHADFLDDNRTEWAQAGLLSPDHSRTSTDNEMDFIRKTFGEPDVSKNYARSWQWRYKKSNVYFVFARDKQAGWKLCGVGDWDNDKTITGKEAVRRLKTAPK